MLMKDCRWVLSPRMPRRVAVHWRNQGSWLQCIEARVAAAASNINEYWSTEARRTRYEVKSRRFGGDSHASRHQRREEMSQCSPNVRGDDL